MTNMTQDALGTEAGSTWKGGVNAPELTERVHSTVDRAASAAHSAADQVTAKTEEWMHTQDRLLASTRDYVRDQPITALGIALAIGFVLSRITR